MKKINSGKVRDIYEIDKNNLMIVVSDRISEFDIIMPNPVPDKYEAGRRQESFDKQFLRDWLKENSYTSAAPPNLSENIIKITKEKYLDAYRILTGEQLPVRLLLRIASNII